MNRSVTKPILISGFGRSGTTWLSDILSKSLGGLLLFEPFHPVVFEEASRFCYETDNAQINVLIDHLSRCFRDSPKNPWILRNHLPAEPESCSPSYLNYIWQNSKIIGCKTIRLNHIVSDLANVMGGQVIHIVRHPFAVCASIKERKNFWKEFNWEWHEKSFLQRTVNSNNFNKAQLKFLFSIYEKCNNVDEKTLFMWIVSLIISRKQLEKCNSLLVSYERLYISPYQELSRILTFLNKPQLHSHPSYFFTPSMTSLNTLHPFFDLDSISLESLNRIFWRDKFDKEEITSLSELLLEIVSVEDGLQPFLSDLSYV